MSLRIGHLSTFYHTSTILQAWGNVAEVLGTDVSWRLFGTGPAIIEAFEKKELDLAYVGLPPALIGISHGVPIRCIASGHEEGTVLSGQESACGYPETESLGDVLGQFRSCRIGVPGKGSIHDVILKEVLTRFGLLSEIETVNFAWSDAIVDSAAKGELQAAIGTPALAVALKTYAGFRPLYPPSKLFPHNPSYGIVAETGYLLRERERVLRFLALHERATALLVADPQRAAGLISAYVGVVDAQFVRETIDLSPAYSTLLSEAYIRATMEFAEILVRHGYIPAPPRVADVFDTSLTAES